MYKPSLICEILQEQNHLPTHFVHIFQYNAPNRLTVNLDYTNYSHTKTSRFYLPHIFLANAQSTTDHN